MGGAAHPSTELSSSPQDCLLLLHTHMRGLLFCSSPLSPSPSCKWNSMDLYCASSPCSAPLVVAAVLCCERCRCLLFPVALCVELLLPCV